MRDVTFLIPPTGRSTTIHLDGSLSCFCFRLVFSALFPTWIARTMDEDGFCNVFVLLIHGTDIIAMMHHHLSLSVTLAMTTATAVLSKALQA